MPSPGSAALGATAAARAPSPYGPAHACSLLVHNRPDPEQNPRKAREEPPAREAQALGLKSATSPAPGPAPGQGRGVGHPKGHPCRRYKTHKLRQETGSSRTEDRKAPGPVIAGRTHLLPRPGWTHASSGPRDSAMLSRPPSQHKTSARHNLDSRRAGSSARVRAARAQSPHHTVP